ncbi:MAG: hypothetical protein B0A82_06910 [Alkalinema sp. CACIAM 70d]|nr:MAG: hypothetical protein B0A82_06910 [Alkalinema sp. CACIAM 70d]
MGAIVRANQVLEFWFGAGWRDAVDLKPRSEWFQKDPNFDHAIRERFLDLYEKAIAHQLDDWMEQPESCLALVILLDQFSRNMFRGQAQAFAADSLALFVASHAIDLGFDEALPPVLRQFFFFPFEHSENLAHQNFAVAKFQQFVGDSDLENTYDYALRHRAVIEQFGRFPHRNEILGRDSTAEEIAFLQQPGSSF